MTLTATRPTEPRAPAARGLVRVTGTRTQPVLWIYVTDPSTYHPTLKITMRTWLRRDLRAKPHDTYPNTWVVTGLNSRDPRAVLATARLDIEWPPPADQDVSHAASFDDLVAPVAKLDSDGRTGRYGWNPRREQRLNEVLPGWTMAPRLTRASK